MSRLSKQIREYVKCPQFDGDWKYGEWGTLELDQRKKIKDLCEEVDMFENTADDFGKENMLLKQQLAEKDKEIEKYKKALEVCVRFYIGFEEATLKDQVSWRETRVKENCEYFIKKALDQIEQGDE